MNSLAPRQVARWIPLVVVPTVLALLLLAGCGFGTGRCNVSGPQRIDAEQYTQAEIYALHDMEQLPKDVTDGAELRVDKEAETVELRYERDGEQMVVTWQITDSRVE